MILLCLRRAELKTGTVQMSISRTIAQTRGIVESMNLLKRSPERTTLPENC
jgi:hypothetical protein